MLLLLIYLLTLGAFPERVSVELANQHLPTLTLGDEKTSGEDLGDIYCS